MPRSVLRLTALLAFALVAGCTSASPSSTTTDGGRLGPTLSRIKAAKTITLGYRESSRPFSYIADDGKPAGYSVDLCTRVAAGVARQLAMPDLQVKWVKVTVPDRMQAVVDGMVDLECGSTTASLSRQEQVDFSIITFVDTGSLLVTDASGVQDFGTLEGKRVAVIPGTTTEKSLREALEKKRIRATVVPVREHAAGVASLEDGSADAYASDRSILIGVGRTSRNPERLSLLPEAFSYEPYGLMLRRGDAPFRLAVNRELAALYRSGDVVPIFERWFGSMREASPFIAVMYLMNGLPE